MHDIERLAITDEIRRLMARYVRYADHQRWQDLASLFTPAGTFTPHKPDGSVWLHMSGREEIAATIGRTAGPGDVYAQRYPWQPEHDRHPQVEVPAGFTFLLGDVFPPGVRTPEERIAAFENSPMRPWYNPINIKVHQKGGHFGPWENPDAFITDIRDTFRGLR